jgi:hypothetical protein
VPLNKLHTDGEFAAHVDIRSYYWLQSRAGAGIYYNLEEYLGNPASSVGSNMQYYRNPPQQAQFDADDATGVDNSGTNWVSILSESSGFVKANGYEVVTCYIRINPTEFGLVSGNAAAKAARNRYEVWRITVLNDECIIGADYMNNIHGYLPCFVGTLNDDVMGAAQRSVAEILTPLQDFASFLVNTHVAGARKNLYGTTFYDPTMVALDKIPQGEVAARVAVNPPAYGKDIRTYIYQMSASGDTSQTLQDLAGVMNLVDQFFPTQSLPSQVASIDRAVSSQVAAVQQGANRRQQKAARLIDDSIFRNIRFAMYYNIIQYATDNEQITDAFTGKTTTINLDKLRSVESAVHHRSRTQGYRPYGRGLDAPANHLRNDSGASDCAGNRPAGSDRLLDVDDRH